MAGKRSGDFLTALESFWNGWASGRKDVLLLVSSSATSWLIDRIIHNKGGLYHRLNHAIHLFPFSLTNKDEESYRLRIADFNKATSNKKSIVLTLISPYGVNKNGRSGIIANVITLEDLMAI